MSYYVNKDVDKLDRMDNPSGRESYLRMDMNENPRGLPSDFVRSVLDDISPDFLSTYPNAQSFIKVYSEHIGLSEDHIRPTNGSDMGIRMIYEVFGEKGKDVVTVSPTFEMYRIYAEMMGLNHKSVRYNEDLSFSMDKLISAIDSNTTIVSILNPNNPIGDVFDRSDIERVIEKARDVGAIVIVDEAYHYFCDSSCVDMIDRYDNVIVLRTFSKIFSLAACRLGVVLSNPAIIQEIFKAQPSFDVNSFALLFGEKVISDDMLLSRLKTEFREGRDYLFSWLNGHGYKTVAGEGNYLFFQPNRDPFELSALLKDKMVLVKTYRDPLLKKYIRLTIGDIASMRRFTDILSETDVI